MPFKHYIQKLEGRLPEYTALGRTREWRCTSTENRLLYFPRTEEILREYVETDVISPGKWMDVFSWSCADKIIYDNIMHETRASQWFTKRFSELDPIYQDFLLTVLHRELVVR